MSVFASAEPEVVEHQEWEARGAELPHVFALEKYLVEELGLDWSDARHVVWIGIREKGW